MLSNLSQSSAVFLRRWCRFWRDDSAASTLEYAAIAALGGLGAVSVSRMLEHHLAHTFSGLTAVLSSVNP